VLEKAGERLALSPRAFHRVIKVARTIADLENSEDILESHVLEALQYRERKN
jgi:magnesium chelatase family protein